MIAADLISKDIAHLKTSETGEEALHWMEIYKVSHLPIVNDKQLLGIISESDIYNQNNPADPVGNHKLSLIKAYVYKHQHIYDVIEVLSRMKLSVVPVLQANKYCGLITLQDLLQAFAKITVIDNTGSIIILELNVNDYQLSEISHIIESNDAKILSMYISSPADSTKLYVTVKINKTDLTSIIQTFERYEYIIKASFMEENQIEDMYKERYELFLKYLNT